MYEPQINADESDVICVHLCSSVVFYRRLLQTSQLHACFVQAHLEASTAVINSPSLFVATSQLDRK